MDLIEELQFKILLAIKITNEYLNDELIGFELHKLIKTNDKQIKLI